MYPGGSPSPTFGGAERTILVMAVATRMVPEVRTSGSSMPPMPEWNTPPRHQHHNRVQIFQAI
eukprot:7377121-Prorocentrum_lima.AAC.1